MKFENEPTSEELEEPSGMSWRLKLRGLGILKEPKEVGLEDSEHRERWCEMKWTGKLTRASPYG